MTDRLENEPERLLVTEDWEAPPGSGSHSYSLQRTFERATCFCPSCGARAAWVEWGSDDYYVGPAFRCAECAAQFTWQGPEPESKHRNVSELAMAQQLKSRTTSPPRFSVQ